MKQKLITTVLLLLFTSFIYAQYDYSTKSKKAIKLYEEAIKYYKQYHFEEAFEKLDKSILKDSLFMEAYLTKADILNFLKRKNEEVEVYKKVIRLNPSFFRPVFYSIAKTEYELGKYKDAKEHIATFLNFDNSQVKLKKKALKLQEKIVFSDYAVNNPVPFEPKNMGENVNTPYNDYWPSLSIDETILHTTVALPKYVGKEYTMSNLQEDFQVSYFKDSVWTKSMNIGSPINTKDNEGAQCLSYDGHAMFYTVCNKIGDYGSCDLYFSIFDGEKWKTPKNLGNIVNSPYWETNPSFSSDNKSLYFASNRKGGKGGKDIWVSQLTDKGFAKPYNLSDSINTSGDEVSPFIHPDNNTLYFASNGHVGLGQFDLFMTRRDTATGKWGKAMNLGYPINTYKDERGMIVNAKGNLALYSSDREGSQRIDIYSFPLYDDIRPERILYVKGRVYDAVTGKPLKAKFDLIDINSEDTIIQAMSNEKTGEYLVCLPLNRDYAFSASKKGYMFYSENFSLKGLSNRQEPYNLDIPLQPIKEMSTVVLKNIFFETNSFKLKNESKAELEKLIFFLSENPNVNIEIGGHTDNVGEQSYNKTLSTNRAKSVANYLISHSVSEKRLTYKGYDFSKPLKTNDTAEGRAKNRRTEFKIISIN